MNHSGSEQAGREMGPVRLWFHRRIQECVRCAQCDAAVSPWDSHCPRCGQENPARVSASAAVYLVIGFVVLAVTFSGLIFAF